jgi:hypothetical protein
MFQDIQRCLAPGCDVIGAEASALVTKILTVNAALEAELQV